MDLIARKTEAVQLIEHQKKDLLPLVNNNPKKFEQYKAVMVELAQNKSLGGCSTESIIHTAVRIVQLGLNPNPLLGEAYVIARGLYKNKKKVGEVAELQIGTKGYKILGYRSGWTFSTQAAYKCDKLDVQLGEMEPKITLVPDWEKRDEEDGNWVFKNLMGVIVFAKDPRGDIHKAFIKKGKLEKIRAKSPTQWGSTNALKGIWLEWAEEMYSKSALKYFIKRLPIDSSVMEVILEDEKVEREDEVEVIETSVLPNSSPALKKGKEIAVSLRNLNLYLYPFEGRGVVEGNTFNSASILKDLGFGYQYVEWFFIFDNKLDIIEACLPDIEIKVQGEYFGIEGEQDVVHEILRELGFNWFSNKNMWIAKNTHIETEVA